MMKKVFALLLAALLWALPLSALATGDDLTIVDPLATVQPEATPAPTLLTVRVFDGEGRPLPGAEVTLTDAYGAPVAAYVTDESAVNVFENLAGGVYVAKAVDPADGYSDTERFNHFDQTTVDLVIHKFQEGSELKVGSPTRVAGAFFTGMWGNNTSDVDVRALLHGYATVAWTSDASYSVDPTVVSDIQVTQGEAGDKTYQISLQKDLTYNDETPITARDYVFSVLLQCAPQAIEAGGMAYVYNYLQGYEAFNGGQSDIFSGVRLIDDYTFSLTVRADCLPFFYELTYINVQPYPIHVIAPGCEVKDDGEGAYIAPLLDENGAPLGEFTAEVLKNTVLDAQSGYLSHPTVSCGPYQLLNYDAESGVVAMQANRLYKGNDEGRKPVIDKLTLSQALNSTLIDDLASGALDVVNKVTDGQVIDDALARFAAEGEVLSNNYMRSGYAFLGYACEQGPTQFENVRKAVASCLDVDALIATFTRNYGLRVYSYYGLGQWMAQPYANDMAAQVSTYAYDLEAARQLLIDDGWTLNERGEAFDAAVDPVRYKLVDGQLMPLAFRFAQLKDNAAAQLLAEDLAEGLRALGASFEAEEMTFDALLSYYYRQQERPYNLFYLATNFTHVFDPYLTFHTDPRYQGAFNTSGIADEQLMQLAQALRSTEPGDTETYTQRWLALMKRYSEVLPTLPLYSNVYFDFYRGDLQEYTPSAHWSWPSAVLNAYLGEELQLPPVEGQAQTPQATPAAGPAGDGTIWSSSIETGPGRRIPLRPGPV